MSPSRPAVYRCLTGAIAAFAALALVACTPAPAPTASPGASTPAASAAQTPGDPTSSGGAELIIPITITHNSVDPNAKKIDVAKGTTVVLEVTSEIADEIHAHTGDGYELEVKPNKTTTGRFVVDETGSFEVESHHLEKVIVILNVR